MTTNAIIEFVLKYWLTALFGIIATWLGILVKHYRKLLKMEKENTKQQEYKDLKQQMIDYVDNTFKETVDEHKKLYQAVLDVQSKQFQRDCYTYLKSSRNITLEEYDSLYRNYEIYKSLGGNGMGTMLFEKVEEKYSTQLLSEKLIDVVNSKQQNNATVAIPITRSTQRPIIPIPPNMIPKSENKDDS